MPTSWQPLQIFEPSYGSFSFLSSMTVAGSNIPTPIPHNITEIAQNIALIPPLPSTKIQVQETGVYRFSYSVELNKNAANPAVCDLWIRVNGIDVPRTSSQVLISGTDGITFPFCDFILQLKAHDYVETYFRSSDNTMQVSYFSTIGIPEVPSIITNIVRIA